jgi:hypothetical protein
MSTLPLVMQTSYAELLERCAATAFTDAFPQDGAFTSKTMNNRRYWYFQMPTSQGRVQRYVGPETAELLERIAHHREARDDERERRALVSTLVRSFGLPRPIPEIGNITEALARAGVFRLRGVLVGTVAYQCYSAMLSIKLPAAGLQTGDVDIAQFKNVSVAIEDHTPPVLDVLKEVDRTFRPVPHTTDARRVTTYVAKGGLRVDFLTPNEGRETDSPQRLPAFHTDAQPIRFLDYLIYEPEPVVMLHSAGVYVLVPAPERYAVHKLIVSRRRREGAEKRDKDLHQAGALLEVLAQKRPHELRLAWQEAYERGKRWRDLITEGMKQLASRSRDITLRVIDRRRAMLGLELSFNNPSAHYDASRDMVTFMGEAGGRPVRCAISGEALDDHFGKRNLDGNDQVKKFLENRSTIERMARNKYVLSPVEEPEAVFIKTNDVPSLITESGATRYSSSKAAGVRSSNELMPSPTYRLFRRAIRDRKQITCTYQECYREICPHVLGHTDGQEMALAYQFAGQSTSRLPKGGQWRCLSLAQVRNVRIRGGAWHTGHRHRKPQACVKVVDVDVNL